MRILKYTLITLLLANAITPLVVWPGIASSHVFPKAILSRSLIEAALICALVYAIRMLVVRPVESVGMAKARVREFARNPLIITLGLFFVSLFVSTLLATDRFWAFWGPIDRAEGFWGMLHLLVFFILGSLFLERRHWLLFFQLSLGVGIVLAARAGFEFFGLFDIKQSSRPSSFIGNSAYLAMQMLFLIAFSALIFHETKQARSPRWTQRLWCYGAPALALLFLVTLFITKSRGVLLGFAAGSIAFLAYYAFHKRTQAEKPSPPPPVRTVSRLLLGFVVIFGIAFFATRDAPVWQSVPGLDRLAQTSMLDKHDASAQVRLGVWRMSWEAYKERPIFGWGPENYLVAFERHYDPALATHGQLWFDRAHNKLLDVLVMQGAFGLLAYLALFGAALFLVAKLANGPKALLIAILIAYFVQNLVFFDNLLSYLTFFALLGYVFRLWRDEKKASGDVQLSDMPMVAMPMRPRAAYFLMAGSALSSLFLIASLYLWNWVPLAQANSYKGATASNSVEKIVASLAGAMTPYNFAQANIRTGAIDNIYLQQFFYNDGYRLNPAHAPLGDILLKGMQDIIDRHPAYDARYYTTLVEMMNGYARSDASYYAKAEPLLRKALAIAPTHQEIHYHLAFNLAGQGRFDEAIQTAQHAVDLSPTALVARLRLGLIYAAAGENVNGQQEIARMGVIDPSLRNLSENDLKMLYFLYESWGMSEKAIPLPWVPETDSGY